MSGRSRLGCEGEDRTPDLRVMHTTTVFTAPDSIGVCWSGLSLYPSRQNRDWGICHSVSTPFPAFIAGTWLGITITKGFPEFDRCSSRNYFRDSPFTKSGAMLPENLMISVFAGVFRFRSSESRYRN